MRAIIASFVTHVVAIGALFVGSVFAPDLLPAPHRGLIAPRLDASRMVRVTDVELPRRNSSRSASRSVVSTPSVPRSTTAPVVAPSGVAPETGLERITTSYAGDVRSVENGSSELPGVGVIAGVEPPPAPKPPVRLHSGIIAPRKIVDIPPVYPTVAQQSRVGGVVIIEATIDEQGAVTTTRVLRSVRLLDEPALEAVRRWRFTPARLNGEAIPVVMTVTVNFTLQ